MNMPPAVAHFSHPKHELKPREYHLPRICNLCGEKLTGSGYSCHRLLCDFDLHEECAQYPETLRSFFAHPWHDLTLVAGTDIVDDDGPRACDLCRQDVSGAGARAFLYRCVPCGFTMHPRCSRLPQTVRSLLHPEHSLAAMPGAGTCAACGEPCNGYVYRCGACIVDLHIACLHGAARRPRAACARSTGGGGGQENEPSSLVGKAIMVGVAKVVLESLVDTFVENL